MEQVEYGKMDKFEKTYWWHRGKVFLVESMLQIISNALPSNCKIIEIGCGTGHVSKVLMQHGEFTGVDISENAIQASKAKGIPNLILGDINSLNIKDFENKFDLVMALDVLEHIQDDLETLSRAKKMLKSGGFFLINVPAHKFLWSEHDEALHHKRRYSKREITEKLKDTGFEVVKSGYFVSTMFPVIALFRVISSLFSSNVYPKTSYILLPDSINNVLTEIIKLESKLIQKMPLPIGTTIFVIARKP